LAANTIKHAKSPRASLKIWYDAKEIVCQIHDEGVIADPMAGAARSRSLDAQGRARAVESSIQVCDQVEVQFGNGKRHDDQAAHETLPRRAAQVQ